MAHLVSRTHEIVVDRGRGVTVAALDEAPLEALLPKTGRLPGVARVEVLTVGTFFAPGSRRRVHLSDGSTALEEVLERKSNEAFRYVVWNYTSKAAAAIRYGVGAFRYFDEAGGRTRIVWTYAFKLDRRKPPGMLGPIGRFLFRRAFMDTLWADTMTATLEAMKAYVERCTVEDAVL